MLDPKVDGLFYWTLKGTSHYGRFTEIERPGRIQHTWMSPKTLGQESIVTLTFKKQGEDTLMTLVHSDLPDHELARGHEKGWNYFLNIFLSNLGMPHARESKGAIVAKIIFGNHSSVMVAAGRNQRGPLIL